MGQSDALRHLAHRLHAEVQHHQLLQIHVQGSRHVGRDRHLPPRASGGVGGGEEGEGRQRALATAAGPAPSLLVLQEARPRASLLHRLLPRPHLFALSTWRGGESAPRGPTLLFRGPQGTVYQWDID